MAKNQGRISFGVDFNVNTANLNKVKKTLQDLQKMSAVDIKAAGGKILDISKMAMHSDTNNLGDMRKELKALEKAFEDAYNPKLGTYELNKFNESLEKSKTSAQQAFQVVAAYGKEGESALLNMTTNMLAVDRAAKQTYSTFQKLGETMMNTMRWSLTSNALNTVTGEIQKAYYYALDLDKSLNDIMIVTDKSASDMENFARQANKAAKALGSTTTEYTDASLIYYQQGLSDTEVAARTDTTLKAAAITGQSADAVSEQLTAVWNGYKVSAEEAELYVDKLSAVAATTAADLEELSVGMSRVASAANIMGVDADQLNAQLATIVSVTREAPESIGTALKTVYARMSDIQAGVDTETTLSEYTTQMAQMGINVLDANGKLRDMGAVVEEIGGKWSSLNREQQVSLAQSIAGTRQYSRMMALFDNWDMYEQALTTSMESAGALGKQHLDYLNSIEAHQNKLTASFEGLYDSIFDSEEIKGVYDTLAGIVTLIDELVQSMGGMPGILATVGMLFAKIAKNSIADLITKQQTNIINEKLNKQQIQNGKALIEKLRNETQGTDELNKHLEKTLELEQKIYDKADNLTDEQWKTLQDGVKEYNAQVQKTVELENTLQNTQRENANYWSSEKRITRTTDKKRRATKIFGQEYYLADEDDLDPSGKSTKGLKSAKERLNKLESEKDALESQNKKVDPRIKNEIGQLKQKIQLAEKENAVNKKQIETENQYAKAVKNSVEATDELGNSLDKTLDKDKFANKMTSIIDNISTIAFTATTASSSFTSLWESFRDGASSIEEVIGGFGSLAMSISPIIAMFPSVKAGIEGVKAGTITGAAAWQAYWSAATMGASIIITLLTTVISIIQSNNKALQEEIDQTIDSAKAAQEKAESNKQLTQSYIELYEAYKKTGEESDALKSAAEAIIETLGLEDLSVLVLKKDYDALTESIKAARLEQSKEKLKAAQDEKTAANTKLSSLTFNDDLVENWISGRHSVEGVISADSTGPYLAYGAGIEDDEKNIDLLAKYIPKYIDMDQYKKYGTISLKEPTTSEEWAEFYNGLKKATKDPGWQVATQDGNVSEIHTSVQQMLNDPVLSTGVKSYESASKIIAQETANVSIMEQEPTKETSLQDFKKQRDFLVESMREQNPEYSEAYIKQLVDTSYNSLGGASAQLLAREKWLEAYESELGTTVISELRNGFNLNNLSNADFSALDLIGIGNLKEKTPQEIIDAAKRKAKAIQETTWSAQSEARLTALDVKREEASLKAEKSTGKQRVKLIQEQNDYLEKQVDILEDVQETASSVFDEAKTDFQKLVKNASLDKQIKEALNQALNSGNWEKVQDIIQEIENSDISESLLNSLIKVQNANNSLLESEKEIRNKQEEIYENKIASFEAEIEYLETIQEQYEKLINTIQNMDSLYKTIYGENSFSQSVELYNLMQTVSLANISNARQSFNDQYSQLNKKDFYNDADWEDAKGKTLDAASSYIGAIQSYIDLLQNSLINSLNSAFETSAKEFTSGQSLEYINKEWEYRKEYSEKYLDNIEKSYKLQIFEKSVLQDINKLANNNAQKRLADMLNTQLDTLKKMEELSEEDITRAEKKIELLKAEIALEDARNNKNSMRLVRNASGAYGYQYVADANAIAAAEQAREEAAQNVYLADKGAYESSITDFQSLYSAFAEEYASAKTPETRQMVLDKYTNDLQLALERNQQLLANMVQYEGYKADSSMQAWLTGLATGGFKPLLDEIIKSTEDDIYSDALKDANEHLINIQTALKAIAENMGLTMSFDTGGYTGSWGSDGKLAVLHEKEIVLNKEDTANILKTIDIVRSLDYSMRDRIGSMSKGYDLSDAAWELTKEMKIEQDVHIVAEFPNATDRNEIEEAFNQIVGLATQHAYESKY